MFIFGTRSKLVNLEAAGTRYCAACEKDRNFNSTLRYQYFHLWYIFRLVTSKHYGITCDSCGRGELVPASEVESRLPRHPIPAWTRFSWVVFVLLILSVGAGGATFEFLERKETAAYLAAPAPKDIYVVELSKLLKDPPASPMYSILQIEEVGAQRIKFKAARIFYNQESGASEDAKSTKALQPQYYGGEALELDKARIQSMKAEGILIAVYRP